MNHTPKESLTQDSKDPLIRYLNRAVVLSVKVLAVLMVMVVWISLADVVLHMVREIQAPPVGLFNIETLISTLGNFLVVLIAIEIFLNIMTQSSFLTCDHGFCEFSLRSKNIFIVSSTLEIF